MKKLSAVLMIFALALSFNDQASAMPKEVFIISPSDGDTVARTFTVKFGIKGITLSPAGVEKHNSGHHHLLVNTGLPDMSYAIPSDDNHIHLGKAQTEATITLSPGTHSLQLLLGDHNHVPHSPPVFSEKITIIVE